MQQRHLSVRSDSGAGLILVMGISLVVFSLIATALMIATSSLRQSKNRTDFELSLAAAEEGVDIAFARQQDAFDQGISTGYAIPSPAGAVLKSATPCAAPEQAEFSGADEMGQARAALEALADRPGCLQQGASGQFVVIRPAQTVNSGTIYAMGWSPSRADANASERMLRVDYIFSPYAPQHAILTGGDLAIDGSVDINVVPNAPPVAGVHTNADLTFTNQSLTVCGSVSGTGTVPTTTYSNDCTGTTQAPTQQPAVALPLIRPLSFYRRATTVSTAADAINQNLWFDLCPGSGTNFTIHGYDTVAPNEPCQGPLLGDQNSPINWGVEYDPSGTAGGPTFALQNAAKSGVYYAHGANLTTKQGGQAPATPPRRTLIASQASSCDPATGNIEYTHFDMADGPYIRNLFLLAEGDLWVGPNLKLGNPQTPVGGMFVAGDEVEMNTSSQGSVGAVVAADRCPATTGELIDDGQSRIQGITFWFDPNAESPFSSIINVTLWQED